MADESYEFVQGPDGGVFMVEDKVSSRAAAYTNLLLELKNIKEEHLIEEGLKMLERLRLSITIIPETPVSVVRGGKGS